MEGLYLKPGGIGEGRNMLMQGLIHVRKNSVVFFRRVSGTVSPWEKVVSVVNRGEGNERIFK